MVGAAELVEHLKLCGVHKAVVFGFPWESADIARMHNDYVLDAAKRYPGILIPFACASVSSPDGVKELSRCASLDFKGVGELAFYIDDEPEKQLLSIAPVVEICKDQKLLLLVHANEPVGYKYPGKAETGLRFYYDLAALCKGIPLILAHWGGGLFFYSLLKKEAREVLENVYYDTAASPYLYRREIYRTAIEIAGAKKILFGSDYPLISPGRYFKEMAEAGISEDHLEMIRGRNAEKLLSHSRGAIGEDSLTRQGR